VLDRSTHPRRIDRISRGFLIGTEIQQLLDRRIQLGSVTETNYAVLRSIGGVVVPTEHAPIAVWSSDIEDRARAIQHMHAPVGLEIRRR
jgi:hypothetical protein